MTDQPPRRSERLHAAKNLEETPSPEPRPRAQSSRKPRDSDYDYRPTPDKDEPTSGIYGSPKRNVQYKEDVSAEAKQAVIDDSVNGFCCAICGFSNHDGLTHNFCHILERSLSGDQELIKHLERKWGLEPQTFFIHSRSNMVILCPNCHTALDKRIFGLLPPSEAIAVVEEFTTWSEDKQKENPISQLFQHDPDNPLKYRLIDLGWTGKSPLVLHIRDEDDEVSILGVHPPFDHPLLENIELHINPVYMMWNLGAKLDSELDMRMFDYLPVSVRADLIKVNTFFESWDLGAVDDKGASTSATDKAAGPGEVVQPEASTSEEDAASFPRRSKRLRAPSNAHDSTPNVPTPPTKCSKGEVQPEASTSEQDAASFPRRSKRLRAPSNAHESTPDVPTPPTKRSKGKTAVKASRR